MTRTAPARFAPTASAVLAFGVAFGYLEAAVVAYLRTAIAAGVVVPAQDPATVGTFEPVEIARELATLAMIAAAGWLAGRTALERLSWAAVIFGTWDIVYYVGLKAVVGWPPSPESWDVLFLIPTPWVSPVWAPMVVSTALAGVGLVAARHLRAGRRIAAGPVRAAAAVLGGALVIASFLVDADAVLSGVAVTWSGWPLFWLGMALAAAATLGSLRS